MKLELKVAGLSAFLKKAVKLTMRIEGDEEMLDANDYEGYENGC